MPLFPVIATEDLVQSGDKTRVDGSKSFASGASQLTSVLIRPSADEDFYDVGDAGVLDWVYEQSGMTDPMPVVATVRAFSALTLDASNNKLDFKLSGVSPTVLTATVAPGDYLNADDLFAAIEVALDAATVGLYPLLDWSVSYSASRIQITAAGLDVDSGSEVTLLPVTGPSIATSLYGLLGYNADVVADHAGTDTFVTVPANLDVKGLLQESSRTIQIISEVADNLFSDDDRLRRHETDILRFVPDGRSTWLDMHRRAQQLILAWLDTEGFIDDFGDKFTIADIKNPDDFQEWSTMVTLRLIFESITTSKDDIYRIKASRYQALEDFYRNRANVRIDLNADGVTDNREKLDTRSCMVVRR